MGTIVIGLGTGRCGTRSLTKLLNEWGIPATHEKYRLVWKPDSQQLAAAFNTLKADVGFYWLNYVDLVLREYPTAKFICLKREREKVVASYMKTFQHPVFCLLWWSRYVKEDEKPYRYCDEVTKDDLEKMDAGTREFVEAAWELPLAREALVARDHFPDYPLDDKRECIEKFWDDYYWEAEGWSLKYPENFLLIDMDEALNTERGRNKIKNFIGVGPNTPMQ